MTYALGSGADTTVAKQIACETGGVFSAVGDNADLALAMASYYKVFAAVRPALLPMHARSCGHSRLRGPGHAT